LTNEVSNAVEEKEVIK